MGCGKSKHAVATDNVTADPETITGNEKKEILLVEDIIKEESVKEEVSREAADPGNAESGRKGNGNGIVNPQSGESGVKSESADFAAAVEEKKDEIKKEELKPENVAVVEENKGESNNEDLQLQLWRTKARMRSQGAAEVSAVGKAGESKNEESEAAKIATEEENKDEVKNEELKVESNDSSIKTQDELKEFE